jgi:hypothetical protein
VTKIVSLEKSSIFQQLLISRYGIYYYHEEHEGLEDISFGWNRDFIADKAELSKRC